MPTYARDTTVDSGASRAEIETGALTLSLPGHRGPLLLTG